MNYRRLREPSCALSFLIAPLLLFISCMGCAAFAQNNQTRTPTETVREFYKAMREKRFREAFALSIYKPAIDGLSAEEFNDLRPDFEKMAAVIPEKIEVNGEQISGDAATDFVKIADADKAAEATVMRMNAGSFARCGPSATTRAICATVRSPKTAPVVMT